MAGRRPLAPLVRASLGLHAVAAAALAVAPGRWPAIAGTVFANHVALAVAGIWPRSRLLGPNLVRLPPAAAARREVALTFDDGPDPTLAPALFDLLATAGARATFFWVGRRVEAHPELVREAVARGHQVENHSFRHSNAFALLPPGALGREIDRAQRALEDAGGGRATLFRAPAGIRSPWLDPLLARRGLTLASWTRRGFDAVDRDPRRVARRLLRGLAPGDILLLHDGGRGARGAAVLEALPIVLATLESRGLVPVTLEAALSPPRGAAGSEAAS